MITQPEPEKKKEYSSRVAVVSSFLFSHPEKPESGIEVVVGRSDIKPTYREIAQAFELDFDFV